MTRTKNNNFIHMMKILGIEPSNTSFYEKLISILGSVISVYLTYIITYSALGHTQSHILFASLGATSILVFLTPHSVLAQPWNVIGGHFSSALLGYIVLIFVPDVAVACSLAVGGSILVMYLTRSIHPPGGATALFVVLSGHAIPPVNIILICEMLLINITVILFIGLIFNNLFHWRRYPSYFYLRGTDKQPNTDYRLSNLSHEDFNEALLHLDSYIDVTAEELTLIFDFALERSNQRADECEIPLAKNSFYSNAALGKYWSVRKVLAIGKKEVSYQTVSGADISICASCSLKEFQQWAKLEVISANQTWIKKSFLLQE